MTTKVETYELILDKRSGTPPQVPDMVPHQQLDQNSPPEVLEKLKSFLFSLDHVEEKQSRNSLPSAFGAYINADVNVNKQINREFTHIHIEPGPGSQHLALTEKEFQQVNEKGWGIKHPWSNKLMDDGLVLVMVYAPRDEEDLENIQKIITAAWHLALSVDD
ncbi:MAG: hypothetical protein ACRBF0_23145 [Calditrichia bacterium]